MADQLAQLDAEDRVPRSGSCRTGAPGWAQPCHSNFGHRLAHRVGEEIGRIETRFPTTASISQSGLCHLDSSSRGSLRGNCYPRLPAACSSKPLRRLVALGSEAPRTSPPDQGTRHRLSWTRVEGFFMQCHTAAGIHAYEHLRAARSRQPHLDIHRRAVVQRFIVSSVVKRRV